MIFQSIANVTLFLFLKIIDLEVFYYDHQLAFYTIYYKIFSFNPSFITSFLKALKENCWSHWILYFKGDLLESFQHGVIYTLYIFHSTSNKKGLIPTWKPRILTKNFDLFDQFWLKKNHQLSFSTETALKLLWKYSV